MKVNVEQIWGDLKRRGVPNENEARMMCSGMYPDCSMYFKDCSNDYYYCNSSAEIKAGSNCETLHYAGNLVIQKLIRELWQF